MLVIQDGEDRIAVMIPFPMYIEMQQELEEARERLSKMNDLVLQEAMRLACESIEFARLQPSSLFDPSCLETARGDVPSNLFPPVDLAGAIANSELLKDPAPFLPEDPASVNSIPPGYTQVPPAAQGSPCPHCGEIYMLRDGKPVTLCSKCFNEGHRDTERCLRCAEMAQLKKAAAKDEIAIAAERDDIDYRPDGTC